MLTFPPDISFVIQIASFLVLWAAMKRLVFDPMLEVLERREQRTSGARKAAEALHSAAQVAAADYERQLREVRLALASEAEAARATTEQEERRALADARDHASAQLMQLRDRLGRQAEEVRPALATEARGLATDILGRVLGRSVA